jgi:hypothetical protein
LTAADLAGGHGARGPTAVTSGGAALEREGRGPGARAELTEMLGAVGAGRRAAGGERTTEHPKRRLKRRTLKGRGTFPHREALHL